MLTAAVVVRQFFLDSLETIGQDLSISPKFEEGIVEFEQDIQNMLEVSFAKLLLCLMHCTACQSGIECFKAKQN